ncbi:MAG: hypothetical protein MUF81_00855 [Verrucomicrobia bacterium]|nr:hypothetical protein [Verrucomicrobiota bacterium]
MKQFSAILFSLLFVWMQTVAARQTFPASAGCAAGAGCGCGQKDCCVTPSSPDSQPGTATPVPASFQNQLSIPAPAALAWTLPGVEAQTFSPVISPSLTVPGVPLFTRHCAPLV